MRIYGRSSSNSEQALRRVFRRVEVEKFEIYVTLKQHGHPTANDACATRTRKPDV
jgi:hypothetical protein